MAAVLVAGFAASGQIAFASSTHSSSKEERKLDKAVAKAEKDVGRHPQDVAGRIELANAYLAAGRFESAVTAYKDAQYLGDTSVRTAFSLALAQIAVGHDKEAVAMLDKWHDSIPAGDFGLALALAGETGRGVSTLSDALRAGEDTPKLRQNLAYAYALDGRWREARVMAAQDVPADKLDQRISEWAHSGREDDYRTRVANLMHVPMRSDSGQPQALALAGRVDEQLAVADAADKSDSELPPIENGESFWVAEAVKPEEPAAAPAEATPVQTASNEPGPGAFDQAFAANEKTAPEPTVKFVSKPVVQQVPVRTAAAEPRTRASRQVSSVQGLVQTREATSVAVRPKDPAARTHLVQLGSFSTAENADRAWRIFLARNPELKNFDKTITKAKVRGRIYYRVAAAGFDKRNAMTLCSSVRGHGYGCIAYAESHPLPGVIAEDMGGGSAKSRR